MRRTLEVELLCCVGHRCLELRQNRFALAIEKEHRLVDHFLVLVRRAEGGAGSDATADVVLETGPRVGAGDFLVAGAPGEEFLDQIKRRTHRFRRRVGTEVTRAVARDAAGDRHARPGRVDVDLEVGIVLVVLESDVEEGLMALDQRRFKVERILLGVRGDVLELRNLRGKDSRLAFHRARRAEVAADSGSEIGRFADVDDPVGGVAERVDARLRRQRGDLSLKLGARLLGGGGGGLVGCVGGHGIQGIEVGSLAGMRKPRSIRQPVHRSADERSTTSWGRPLWSPAVWLVSGQFCFRRRGRPRRSPLQELRTTGIGRFASVC